MTKPQPASAFDGASIDAAESPFTDFAPVRVRKRSDGWTPEVQVAFIEALAECACVVEACARVGRSPHSAYALRRRLDAQSFREAWDAALTYGIRRLSDAAFSRAINGVATPVFYKGEQVGERRRYDERLTMFLLRYRDPLRYGKWLDTMEAEGSPEFAAIALARVLGRVESDAWDERFGRSPRHREGSGASDDAGSDFPGDVV